MYRAHKWLKKNRAAVLATGAVGGALFAGAIGTTWGYWRAEHTAQLARQTRLEADVQHDAAEFESYVANIALAQLAIAAEYEQFKR